MLDISQRYGDVKNNEPQFLAGKSSSLRLLDGEVLAASLNVSNVMIDGFLGAQKEAAVLGCPFCAEGELEKLKSEKIDDESKRRADERKREDEEAMEEEEERRKREEEEKKQWPPHQPQQPFQPQPQPLQEEPQPPMEKEWEMAGAEE